MNPTPPEHGSQLRLQSDSPEATQEIGRRLGLALRPGDWIGLAGDLGAGKTCLTQGLALGAGVDPAIPVTSPTFILLRTYPGRIPLHHLDLYRIATYYELLEIGYQDLLAGQGACVVEWCDRVPESRPADGLVIELELLDEHSRSLSFAPLGPRGRDLVRGNDRILYREACGAKQ